jgi:hypothetical protein
LTKTPGHQWSLLHNDRFDELIGSSERHRKSRFLATETHTGGQAVSKLFRVRELDWDMRRAAHHDLASVGRHVVALERLKNQKKLLSKHGWTLAGEMSPYLVRPLGG